MTKHIYFLDFENLQSTEEELTDLIDDTCEIYLFHGAHQNNFPPFWIDVSSQIGKRLHRIQLKESANNALDFFISYYIGKLSNDETLHFHIISNDKGYDPLIDHLVDSGKKIDRIARKHNQTLTKAKAIIHHEIDPELVKLAKIALSKNNRPKHKEKLINLIKSSAVFGRYANHNLPDIINFIEHLESLGFFTITQTQVRYALPVQSSPQVSQSVKQQITQVLSPKMTQQIQNIFSKANRPSKESSLKSVIESSVITQKDNLSNLSTNDVIQYLQLTKTISIHAGSVTYQTPISKPLLNQHYEKCQKILNKINERSRPTTEEKYIASIKSWVKCTSSEAVDIYKLLKKNNKIIR
ncbi:PIN domain-containing protein [Wohlfahrtiimonas larvae]|uniref:PIN-like domain-containing protein n=1 Tax=Wohlfahrtiimonas larvae TaxID=1157986 RepID=A0ABP9MG11_9GAMM|nr:PIN domain-containing protein [Wohlfahrtiimonas larvae]